MGELFNKQGNRDFPVFGAHRLEEEKVTQTACPDASSTCCRCRPAGRHRGAKAPNGESIWCFLITQSAVFVYLPPSFCVSLPLQSTGFHLSQAGFTHSSLHLAVRTCPTSAPANPQQARSAVLQTHWRFLRLGSLFKGHQDTGLWFSNILNCVFSNWSKLINQRV